MLEKLYDKSWLIGVYNYGLQHVNGENSKSFVGKILKKSNYCVQE